MNFNELLLRKEILEVIKELGYDKPTPIQEKIIPFVLKEMDVLGQSQTGTGKTLAYAAPILSSIEENKKTQVLIMAPTRELAIQIGREIEGLGKYTKISVTCVYGSSPINTQINLLKKGSEIVVGTPGRIKDLLERKALRLENIKFFVLDEADEMLSMGFKDDLEFIFKAAKTRKQVLLFSATMPKEIKKLAEKYMTQEYKTVTVASETETADNIEQNYYLIDDKTRIEAMCRVMDYYNPKKAIIFCRTKKNADDVVSKLSARKYDVDVIHGDVTQGQRIATLDRFKAGRFNYLVATDVAARGIHVSDIDLIINYNLPESNEAYIHRIGRTGRANKSGIAVSFVKDKEMGIIRGIERQIKTTIIKKEIPKINEILPNRAKEVINRFNQLTTVSVKNPLFKEYIENLNKEEINNLLEALLAQELTGTLGSNFDLDINIKNSKEKRNRNIADSTRVFMTIGKMDKIEKRELLEFIEQTANIPQNTCSCVEIMTKFTFMNVQNEYLEQVLKTCNNVKYNGRVIKIEKAKK